MIPLWSEFGDTYKVVGYHEDTENAMLSRVPDRVWFTTEFLNSLAGHEPSHGWETVHSQHMIVCENLKSANCTQCFEKNGKYCDPPTLECIKFTADDGKKWIWQVTGEQKDGLELAVWKD